MSKILLNNRKKKKKKKKTVEWTNSVDMVMCVCVSVYNLFIHKLVKTVKY